MRLHDDGEKLVSVGYVDAPRSFSSESSFSDIAFTIKGRAVHVLHIRGAYVKTSETKEE